MSTVATAPPDETTQRALVFGIARLILEPFEHHARTHETTQAPVPIWGWGDMPDQYGRRWVNDTGDDLD